MVMQKPGQDCIQTERSDMSCTSQVLSLSSQSGSAGAYTSTTVVCKVFNSTVLHVSWEACNHNNIHCTLESKCVGRDFNDDASFIVWSGWYPFPLFLVTWVYGLDTLCSALQSLVISSDGNKEYFSLFLVQNKFDSLPSTEPHCHYGRKRTWIRFTICCRLERLESVPSEMFSKQRLGGVIEHRLCVFSSLFKLTHVWSFWR